MTSKGSKTRIKWEGDSNKEIRSWPDDIRANIGLELHRLDNHEEPLDSKSMGKSLPGVRELRDKDKDFGIDFCTGFILDGFTWSTASRRKRTRLQTVT